MLADAHRADKPTPPAVQSKAALLRRYSHLSHEQQLARYLHEEAETLDVHQDVLVRCHTITTFSTAEDADVLVSVFGQAAQSVMTQLRATQLGLLLPNERIYFDAAGSTTGSQGLIPTRG